MIYDLVSSKEVIARINLNNEIDYSAWIPKVPLWVADVLEDLNVYYSMEIIKQTTEVIDYKFKLPCNIKLLKAIAYEGFRLESLGTTNNHEPEDIQNTAPYPKMYHHAESYELDKNGYGSVTFESGYIDVYFITAPVEYDITTKILFPIIPNKASVKEAIEYKVIEHLLRSGHKIGTYNLHPNDTTNNPKLLYNEAAKKARNDISDIDPASRYQISKMIRSLLYDQTAYYESHFKSK